jgi:hypothetical protein
MQRMMAFGVDGIFTDKPDILVKERAKFLSGQQSRSGNCLL